VPVAKSHTLHHNISHLIHAVQSHGSVPVSQAAAVGHCVSLAHTSAVVLETDASLSGWGAALKGLSVTSAGWWRKHSQHINKLKLKAILLALHSLAPVLHNQSVLMHCNNMTAVAYINHLGGHNPAMNRTTHKIFNLCQHLNVHITTTHLPGEWNGQANHLSQLFPQHKWSITPHLFNALNQTRVFTPLTAWQ